MCVWDDFADQDELHVEIADEKITSVGGTPIDHEVEGGKEGFLGRATAAGWTVAHDSPEKIILKK